MATAFRPASELSKVPAARDMAQLEAKRIKMDEFWEKLLRSPEEQRREGLEARIIKHKLRSDTLETLKEENRKDLENILAFIEHPSNASMLPALGYVRREDGVINLSVTDEVGRKYSVIIYPRLSIDEGNIPIVESELKKRKITLGRFKDTISWKVAKFLRETDSPKIRHLVDRLLTEGVVKRQMRLAVRAVAAPSVPIDFDEPEDQIT